MTFARELVGVADATPARPRVIRAADQRSPRPLEPDAGEAYRDHLEEELARLIDREARLVDYLTRLSRRFGVRLPSWIESHRALPTATPCNGPRAQAARRATKVILEKRDKPSRPIAGLLLDPASGRVLFNAQRVPLPPIERLLLGPLFDRAGQLVSRGELVKAGWGVEVMTKVEQHRLRVSIARLRAELRKAGWPGSITTEPDLGYILEASAP